MKTSVVSALLVGSLLVVGGCSTVKDTLNSNDPVGTAKNVVVCKATEGPRGELKTQINNLINQPASKAAAASLASGIMSIIQATNGVGGALSKEFTELDAAVTKLAAAEKAGASKAELATLTSSVTTKLSAIDTQCAAYSK